MSAWILKLIAGAGLVGALALGGTGAAMAWNHNGWTGPSWGANSPSGMMGNSGQSGYGPGGMMGNGGMMGGYGPGSMMGGGQQSPATQSTPVTGVTQVTIQNFAYQPTNIQVPVGTTITWTNQDTAPHTVTFRNGMKESGLLKQGQSFSYKFTTPGTYAYYCAVHPNMAATVTVTS